MNNYLNGNLTDAKNQVKRLSKRKLVELIDYWMMMAGTNNAMVAIMRLT